MPPPTSPSPQPPLSPPPKSSPKRRPSVGWCTPSACSRWSLWPSSNWWPLWQDWPAHRHRPFHSHRRLHPAHPFWRRLRAQRHSLRARLGRGERLNLVAGRRRRRGLCRAMQALTDDTEIRGKTKIITITKTSWGPRYILSKSAATAAKQLNNSTFLL